MGLQLKGEENNNTNNVQNTSEKTANKSFDNPWGDKDIEDNFYNVNVKEIAKEKKNKAMWVLRSAMGIVFRVALVVLVIIAFVFLKIYVDKKMHPVYRELEDYIYYDEKQLSGEFDSELLESDKWMSDIFWWITGRDIKIFADDDVGVYYFDNRKVGIHLHTDKYKLFGMQVGMGDKAALKETTYIYEDYFYLYDDFHNDKNSTTYYYYNTENNDCIALTKNDSYNLIEGITYINNYQYFISHLGKMNMVR